MISLMQQPLEVWETGACFHLYLLHISFLLVFTGKTLEKPLLISGVCNLFTLRGNLDHRGGSSAFRINIVDSVSPKTSLRTDPGGCIMRQHGNTDTDAEQKSVHESL